MTTTKPASKSAAPATTTAKPATKAVASPKKAVAQPAVKPVKKPATKSTVKAVAKPASKPVAKSAAAKPTKVKKPKMVRDSFTFPKLEYAVLDTLKLRAAKLGKPVKKTELLRAGLKAIAGLSDSALLAALNAVPSLKTGRPAKS
jgi:hypothetical protein